MSAPGNVFYSLAGNPSDPTSLLPPSPPLGSAGSWSAAQELGFRSEKRAWGGSGYVHHHDQEKHVWLWVSSLAFHQTMEGCFLLGLESSIHILMCLCKS